MLPISIASEVCSLIDFDGLFGSLYWRGYWEDRKPWPWEEFGYRRSTDDSLAPLSTIKIIIIIIIIIII